MKETQNTKRYFLLHPQEVGGLCLGGVFLLTVYGVELIYIKSFLLILCPLILFLAVYIFHLALRRIRIDEIGITLYGFLQKKRTILWDELNCHGYFVHATYYKRFRRFFYFSRIPLHGGVNFLGLGAMPSPTDDLLYVAEQRDVEEVIEYYYQQHKGKKKRR